MNVMMFSFGGFMLVRQSINVVLLVPFGLMRLRISLWCSSKFNWETVVSFPNRLVIFCFSSKIFVLIL